MSDLSRSNLPIPHREHIGLTTYDAKDPDTSYPPIEPLRPPEGAPNVVVIMIDDAGFGSASAFGGPCDTPVADRLLADAPIPPDGPKPPRRRHGGDHRDCHLGAGLQLNPA
jgi:hypothetical protein